MTFKTKLTPKLSMLALSITMVSAYANDGYDGVVYFGDSLSDAGYFAPISQGKLGISQSGQFTTNPEGVWTDHLSQHLNAQNIAHIAYVNQSGNNYAVGGARAGVDFSNAEFNLPVPSAKTQVATYLDTGLRSNALHSVWAGANDLFAASSDAANAQSIIISAAQSHAEAIGTLHKAGAKYILVPTLPDVGLTPDFVGKPAGSIATSTSQLYNTLLINQAKSTGANIIPLDTFHLLQEVANNPSAYGIDNMTDKACGSTNSLLCGQAHVKDKPNYFFADGVHPTGKAHRMIGDYAYQTITAPTQLSALSHIATMQGLMAYDTVKNHSKDNAWLSIQATEGNLGKWHSDKAISAIAGKSLYQSDNAILGVYGGYHSASYQIKTIDADMDDILLGVYHAGTLAGLDIHAQAGLGILDSSSARTVLLDSYRTVHHADGKGKRFGASFEIAKPILVGQATISPYLSATAQSVRLDALTEHSSSATAMSFDEQKYQSTYGKAGVDFQYPIGKLSIKGDIHYQNRLSGNTPTPSASLNTLPLRFETPKADFDKQGYGASLGITGQVGKVDVGASLRHYTADNDRLTSIGISASKRF